MNRRDQLSWAHGQLIHAVVAVEVRKRHPAVAILTEDLHLRPVHQQGRGEIVTEGRETECPARRDYNEERPHEALGQTPPADHYECSPRRYSGRLREPEYGADYEVRRVHHSGEIRWRGYYIYISESPAKEPVGLVERDDGDWDIHFGPVPLGRIDRKGRFHRPKRKRRRRKPVRG